MTGAIETYEADTLSILVIVTQDGEAKDLTGATVAAKARRQNAGGEDVAAAASLGVAASGQVSVGFAAGALVPGVWTLQVRATIGAEIQTVAEVKIRSRSSYVQRPLKPR